MKETIYISIPITGHCEETQRRKATFYQNYFEKMGKTVINPFDIGYRLKARMEIYGKEPSYGDYMREDLLAIHREATEIFLCSDWQNSKGCMDEVDAGIKKGLRFICESWLKWSEINI